jgi:CHASE2 domain-containing sensor protein
VAASFANSPFDLDWALRAISLGWFPPERVTPIALVDLDVDTQRRWGNPAQTPRDDLARMIETVSAAGAAAVVVDIDLSWSGDAPGQAELASYLGQYRRPVPLIFPKRLDSGPDGSLDVVGGPLDAVVAANSRLYWAHANFESDSDGSIRQWAPWLATCESGRAVWLPAVAVQVAMTMNPAPAGSARPSGRPAPPGDCRGGDGEARQRLIIGERLLGPAASSMATNVPRVAGGSLLDPQVARDDQALFQGRVVLIGTSAPSSGDLWLTPSGSLPGVELLANSIRYFPVRAHVNPSQAFAARMAAVALAGLLVVLASLGWRFGVVFILSAIACLASLYVAIAQFAFYGVIEIIEDAIVLTIVVMLVRMTVELFAEVYRAVRSPDHQSFGRRIWRGLKTILMENAE